MASIHPILVVVVVAILQLCHGKSLSSDLSAYEGKNYDVDDWFKQNFILPNNHVQQQPNAGEQIHGVESPTTLRGDEQQQQESADDERAVQKRHEGEILRIYGTLKKEDDVKKVKQKNCGISPVI